MSRVTTVRVLWALTAVALVATVALAATRGRDWWEARATERAQNDALAAGRQLAVNFATIDYRKVAQDTDRVKAGATGEFLASYTSQLEDLRKVIVDNKSVSKVERSEAALVTGDQDSATVIVGLIAPTSNSVVPQGEKKTYRTKLGLRRVGEQWKVERLEFVG
jgi:Mce-associated membrane protein